MLDYIKEPWPWYVTGPLIGSMVPLLLIFANKSFGISSSLRHFCAMCAPLNIKYFKYDWKSEKWNLFFVLGIVIGGFVAFQFLMGGSKIDISQATVRDLSALGVQDYSSYLPDDIFGWEALLDLKGLVFVILGGFLVGFGARYANGCTSGHSISGISNFQIGSVIATISFFFGGLIMTHIVLPHIF